MEKNELKKAALYSELKTKKMVYTALMTALVFIATFSIKIPVPFSGGYIHPGDSMVFLSGLLLGPLYGAFAAGVGSALSDLLGGYTFWIIPTLIIKSLMGMIVGILATKSKEKLRFIAAACFSTIWTVFTFIAFILTTKATEGTELFNKILIGLSLESEMDMTTMELTTLLHTTSRYLLIILLAIPLFIFFLILFQRYNKKSTYPIYISLSYILAGTVMVFGYFITYGILVQNYLVPIFSIPSNMLQFIGGFIIASFLTPVVLIIKKNTNQTMNPNQKT